MPMTSERAPRYLVIKAKGGLGNRMLSAVNGLIYADLANRTPIIDWRDGAYAARGVNAYPLLFDTPLNTDVSEIPADARIQPAIWSGYLHEHPVDLISRQFPRHHANPLIYRALCVSLRKVACEADVAVFWSYVPKNGRMRRLLKRHPQFEGRALFDVYHSYLTKYFTPRAPVLAAVSATIRDQVRPVIGVHIRYTDLRVPVGKIEQALRSLIAAEPHASLFLATDNLGIQQRIEKLFRKVIVTNKWLPEDGKEIHYNPANDDRTKAAEEALIDMWCLSRCDRLVFSSNSTFSLTSRILGRFADDKIIDVERGSLKHYLKTLIRDYA